MALFNRILIPTDFSKNANMVYAYVYALAEKYDFKVDLIHVIPKISYLEISEAVFGNPFKVQQKYIELRESLNKRLRNEMEIHIPRNHRGDVYVKGGVKVTESIIEHCHEQEYDLIVIGSRGEGNAVFKKGRVTEKLIRLSAVPVMSFTGAFSHQLTKITVPTDGSSLSFEAFSYALQLADHYQASIELYSVMDFDADRVAFMGGDPHLKSYIVEGLKKSILDELEKCVGQQGYEFKNEPNLEETLVLDHKGREITITIHIEENPSAHRAIVEYANDHADLVVMTTHGRSGMAKVLIGSVAEKVVRHVEVPVITIKPSLSKK